MTTCTYVYIHTHVCRVVYLQVCKLYIVPIFLQQLYHLLCKGGVRTALVTIRNPIFWVGGFNVRIMHTDWGQRLGVHHDYRLSTAWESSKRIFKHTWTFIPLTSSFDTYNIHLSLSIYASKYNAYKYK